AAGRPFRAGAPGGVWQVTKGGRKVSLGDVAVQVRVLPGPDRLDEVLVVLTVVLALEPGDFFEVRIQDDTARVARADQDPFVPIVNVADEAAPSFAAQLARVWAVGLEPPDLEPHLPLPLIPTRQLGA